MSLPGSEVTPDELRDVRLAWPTRRVDEVRGRMMRFVTDEVTTPDGHTMVREYLEHPGAVAIIAVDDQSRLAVVIQYRHPVGYKEVEAPAGLLDVEREDPLAAAQRELREEAELAARVGVSRKTINTVENGVFVPSTILALRLAAALKRKVEDIFALKE